MKPLNRLIFASASTLCFAASDFAAPCHAAQQNCVSTHAGTWFPANWTPPVQPLESSVGNCIALSANGERVAIASGFYPVGGMTGIGTVWVLDRATRTVEATLTPPLLHNYMAFGSSLAMDEAGGYLVVGAPGFNGNRGRVFGYQRVNGAWQEVWHQPSSVLNDTFGVSVALSDSAEWLAVGAPSRPNPNMGFAEPGVMCVYRRQNGVWVPDATITSAMLPLAKNIGWYSAMSRDGRTLAFSSLGWTNEPIPNGAVYVMQRTDSGWSQAARLQEPVAYSTGGWGTAIAMDAGGSLIVVGNYVDSRFANLHGAASVFRRLNGTWTYETALLPSQPDTGSVFGRSLALNAAGDRLRVGAPGAQQSVGVIEEFEWLSGAWQRVAVHSAPNPSFGAGFGRYVINDGSATGGAWVASEPFTDYAGTDSGLIHFFEANCLTPTVYCSAQPNSLGCTPQIAAKGTPSLASASGFTLSATQVRNQQNGMLLHGFSGRATLPWLGGTLCVRPPLRRTPVLNSGGAAAPVNNCSGVLQLDFNTWASSATDPLLFPGQHVRAQFYSRDPGSPSGLNLTDAIEFYLDY